MKSQMLTNILLLVIAVATLGSFFQGQAAKNAAEAFGTPQEVIVKNQGLMEALPVIILDARMLLGTGIPTEPPSRVEDLRRISPDMLPTELALVLNARSPWRVDERYNTVERSLINDYLERMTKNGIITSSEADKVRKLCTVFTLPEEYFQK